MSTTTWSLTAGQFITDALDRLGNLPAGGVPTDDQFNKGILAFNALLKGNQADGPNLYRITNISIAVGAMQGCLNNPIIVTPLVLNLQTARVVVTPEPNLYERPLAIYSYADYSNLPNKMAQTTSGPSLIVFNRQTTQSIFYCWPLPTFGCTINAMVSRTVNDVVNPEDPVDIPSEFTEGYIWSLADRLMDYEGMAAADQVTADRITQHAVAFQAKLENYDRPDSVYVRPYGRRGSGRFWR